jgi:hypothetical protein
MPAGLCRSQIYKVMMSMKKVGIESSCEGTTKQIVKEWLTSHPVYPVKNFELDWNGIHRSRVTLAHVIRILRAKRQQVAGLDLATLNTLEHQPQSFTNRPLTQLEAKQIQEQAVACCCARMLSAPNRAPRNHPILAANKISVLLKAYHIDRPGRDEVLAIPVVGTRGVFKDALQSLYLLRLNTSNGMTSGARIQDSYIKTHHRQTDDVVVTVGLEFFNYTNAVDYFLENIVCCFDVNNLASVVNHFAKKDKSSHITIAYSLESDVSALLNVLNNACDQSSLTCIPLKNRM